MTRGIVQKPMTLVWLGIAVLLGADAPDSLVATHLQPIHAVVAASSGRAGGCVATGNFQVCCCGTTVDPNQVAKSCEQLRTHLRKTWLATEADSRWTPRCQVIVHASVASYVRQLGPGSEQTSGCSSIELDAGRVVLRRIDLRADAAGWLTDSLPHELTHVVLADRFSERQVPRWADEGIAILSESVTKQQLRERTWLEESHAGQQFTARDLFAVGAYPPANRHNAFYGQSASLSRFLIERGTAAQFVTFVETSQRKGTTAALRAIYSLDGVEHLERLWVARRPAPNGSILLAEQDRTRRNSISQTAD
ncbi:MAG: hypothetical protein HZA46_07100 [Planctomycetales bacterium]|nr:hypothetical protein [Planctomycetales bacterium]